MLSSAVDISDHVKVSLKLVGQLLCELLVEYKSLLSKIRELLLTDGMYNEGGGGGGGGGGAVVVQWKDCYLLHRDCGSCTKPLHCRSYNAVVFPGGCGVACGD